MLEVMNDLKIMIKKFQDKSRSADVCADQETCMSRPDDYKIGFQTGLAEAYTEIGNILTKYYFILEDKLPEPMFEDLPEEERTLDDNIQYKVDF